ncbi:MAG: DUF3500 domain-containing protein [Bacteroidota bacterium]
MQKGLTLTFVGLLVGLVGTGFWIAQSPTSSQTHQVQVPQTLAVSPMTLAAQSFIGSMNEEQKKMALFPFENTERKNWHFTPVRRKGLMWEQMNEDQHQMVVALLKTALSKQGYDKVEEVRKLELVLREVEGRGPNDRYRHPDRYFLSFFGKPSDAQPWGWRFEGHHLSTNFSSISGEIAVTPLFYGSNPGEVPIGKHKGKRVLKAEEDLARGLLEMLEPSQLEKALLSTDAPDEILSFEDTAVTLDTYDGLPISELNEPQKVAFLQLLRVYLDNMNTDLAEAYYAQIEAEGWDNTYFLWLGSKAYGERHYYRIHNPALLIEYDNTQNGANHIHAVWRDPRNDFGVDLLKEHYRTSSHHKK